MRIQVIPNILIAQLRGQTEITIRIILIKRCIQDVIDVK
jgi:hypothetical protein